MLNHPVGMIIDSDVQHEFRYLRLLNLELT